MLHKVIITLLKPLSFLPALLVMYMIFSFSAQNGTESGDLSFKVSVKLVEVGSEVLDMKLTDSEIQMYANKYHHYVRKLGHMTEYCVLALSLIHIYQRKTDDHFPDCSTVNRTGNLSDYAYHCTDL